MRTLLRCIPLCACLVCKVSCAQQLPPPEVPVAPARTLPEAPPFKPPQITCADGQLTILAENASISSVLDKLRPCIGVEIRMPVSYADERMFLHLGPGPQREVLDSLFSSTELNYIIESSGSTPAKIVSVSLTLRTGSSAEGDGRPTLPSADLALTPARRAWREALEAVKHGATVDGDALRAAAEEIPQPPATDLAPPLGAKDVATKAPGSAGTAEVSARPGGHAVVAEGASNANPPAETMPSAVAVPTTAIAVPAAAPNVPAEAQADPAAGPVLQKQINQMQHMFEERKKMNARQSSGPPAQP